MGAAFGLGAVNCSSRAAHRCRELSALVSGLAAPRPRPGRPQRAAMPGFVAGARPSMEAGIGLPMSREHNDDAVLEATGRSG